MRRKILNKMKNLILAAFIVLAGCSPSSKMPTKEYINKLPSNQSLTGIIWVDWDWRKTGFKTWFIDYWLIDGKYYKTTYVFKTYPNENEKKKLRIKRVTKEHINKFNRKLNGDR